MGRTASLPQYDLPVLRKVTDAWWAGIAKHLRRQGLSDIPEQLLRTDRDEAVWRQPGLIVTQTCGYPLMTELLDHLRPVATPVYGCEGCTGSRYSSAFIVREGGPAKVLEDLRGRKAAINNWNSQSGMNALRLAVAPLAEAGTFFESVRVSGGHALSMAAVREGAADIAAIDAVTLALHRRHVPDAVHGLRVLGWSATAPSLPYATALGQPEGQDLRVFQALSAAAEDPDLASVRADLLIDGFAPCSLATYREMLDQRDRAAALGYPDLR